MTEPNGHVCPGCAAPRAADGTPSCGCAQRASDALRAARTAEAAAAEDFDPLRIRPYVELGDGSQAEAAHAPPGEAKHSAPEDPAERTMPLKAVPPEPYASDVRLFQEPDQAPDAPPVSRGPSPAPGALPPVAPEPRRRRWRRTALLGTAGAVVGVVAAAGFASGLFSYEAPVRDGALPDDARVSVPDVSPDASSVSPSVSEPLASPSPSSAAPSPSTSPSASATPSASRSSASPSPTPTTTRATGTAGPTSGAGPDNRRVQVLRRGDKGPEVTELQLRLRQLSLYTGDANGNYNSQVEDAVRRYQWARGITADEPGVYGTATRTSLESETTNP